MEIMQHLIQPTSAESLVLFYLVSAEIVCVFRFYLAEETKTGQCFTYITNVARVRGKSASDSQNLDSSRHPNTNLASQTAR